MVIGTGTANGAYSRQVSAGNSPAVPGASTSGNFPNSVVHPVPIVPAPPAGGGAVRQAQAGGSSCSWNPEIFRPEAGLAPIAGFNFSGDKYRIPSVQVPGTGVSKDGCGKWVKKLKSGDEVRDIYHSCDVLGCPVCVESTITKKAKAFEERFAHYEDAKLQENAVLIPGEYRRAIPRHIIFSISPAHIAELWVRSGKNHGRFLDLARDELKTIIKDTGLIGGVIVYHPNRVRHPDTGLTGKEAKALLVREAMVAGDMKDDSPAADLYAHIRKQTRWERYYFFAPHFHTITFGKIIDGHEFDEKYPGWHYINKGNVPNPGGLARYLFSHMAMLEDRHSVSWFGRMSSAVLGVDEIKHDYKEVICEKTGLPWVIIESEKLEEIGKHEMELITEYRSFFRTGMKRPRRAPGALVFPKSGKRSMAPPEVYEKGILALARYCDEWGRI